MFDQTNKKNNFSSLYSDFNYWDPLLGRWTGLDLNPTEKSLQELLSLLSFF